MHFAQPQYLQFLWSVPLMAAFLYWALRRRWRRLHMVVAPALVPRLAGEHSRARAALRAALLPAFFLFALLALARPQWGARTEEIRRRGVDVILALDTSFSMNTEDVAPSRLQKAKAEIRSLIGKLRGDRVGLICFAGSAVLQCPLTLDYGAVAMFLDVADTQIVPDPGTSLAAAIATADASFIAGEKKYKVLVLFTDGEDLEGEIEAAVRKARAAGIVIHAIGIGTPEGRPIPVRDADGNVVEYRKDENGRVVVSRLDEANLARIAEATGGRYYRATTSEEELDGLCGEISGMEKKELDARLYRNLEERFQYPLAAALGCLAARLWITERRRPAHGERTP